VVTLALKKNSKSRIGLKVKLQSAFNAFRDLLPSANNSAEWSGRVWQPPANTNGCLAHLFSIWSVPNIHYYLQWDVTPNPANSNYKKVCQTAICICRGLSQLTGWAVLLSENISQHLCQGKPSEDVYSHLFLMNDTGLTENMDKGYYLPWDGSPAVGHQSSPEPQLDTHQWWQYHVYNIINNK
jgi:hypothetical protein